jgi:hypothetical protein
VQSNRQIHRSTVPVFSQRSPWCSPRAGA